MSHALIDVTVVVRLKVYPSYTDEDARYRPWGQVKADAIAALVGQRVLSGKPTFWEWLTGQYAYEPQVTEVKSSKLIEEIFDGE
jgi:hypothetical protein